MFSRLLNAIHTEWREKPFSTTAFIRKAEEISQQSLKQFIQQWIEREDLPAPIVRATTSQAGAEWVVTVDVEQQGRGYDFFTTLGVETDAETVWEIMRVQGENTRKTFSLKAKPRKLLFNTGNDIPVDREAFYTLSNLFDDFHQVKMVYGTSRQIEAHHTLALRYQSVLADAFTEILPPLRPDAEVSEEDLQSSDPVMLGVGTDNSLLQRMAEKVGIQIGKNFFRWNNRTYGNPDDGMIAVFPSPVNKDRPVYLILANSAMQLYHMTKRHQPLPSWGVFKGDQILERGVHFVRRFEIGL
jgi:hypothetical protein